MAYGTRIASSSLRPTIRSLTASTPWHHRPPTLVVHKRGAGIGERPGRLRCRRPIRSQHGRALRRCQEAVAVHGLAEPWPSINSPNLARHPGDGRPVAVLHRLDQRLHRFLRRREIALRFLRQSPSRIQTAAPPSVPALPSRASHRPADHGFTSRCRLRWPRDLAWPLPPPDPGKRCRRCSAWLWPAAELLLRTARRPAAGPAKAALRGVPRGARRLTALRAAYPAA
jgi:hypothetical protein